MNFSTPESASWFGGVVGSVSAGGAHVSFDDRELRVFPTEEAVRLWESGLLKHAVEAGGLIDNRRV
eukprot:3926500-Pleurochrysis_carterae.AAC.1